MSLSVWELFPLWVGFLLSQRQEVFVALDWTDFDADGHSVIALNMITSHGRATPLMWKTHEKSKLKQHRTEYEDNLLEYFRDIVPLEVRVTVLADRGFGDQALYKSLERANIDFVIRFRGGISVTDRKVVTTTAAELVPASGRAKKYEQVRVTNAKTTVPAIACLLAGEEHERALVHCDEPRRLDRVEDHCRVLETVHDRGEFPPYERPAFRHGPLRGPTSAASS